ncbi:MAG: hypothetical protein KTR16_10625 [Acidiferrobacterales bacterium]|nr:hypothetical protein [Acidiferrobacterales bacterium]
MKNIIVSLILLVSVAACSSGSTVAEVPFNVSGIYNGTFENTDGTQSGSFTLNIVEDESTGAILGNIIFETEDNTCFVNGSVTGSTSSFSVFLEADQTFQVTEISPSFGVVERTEFGGTISYVLTQSNNGNTLAGTYISTVDLCSNFSGAGTVQINR